MESPTPNPEHTINSELLERIRQLYFLTRLDKINILLMFHRKKPASIIELPYAYGMSQQEAKTDPAEWQRSNHELEEILKALSLPYEPFYDDEFPEYSPSYYYIGKDQKHLDELLDAKGDEKGLALGYPKTAVEAYAKKQREHNKKLTIHTENLPEEIRSSPIIKVINFNLSADHWQEELEQIKQNAQFIEKQYPSLYQEIIDNT